MAVRSYVVHVSVSDSAATTGQDVTVTVGLAIAMLDFRPLDDAANPSRC